MAVEHVLDVPARRTHPLGDLEHGGEIAGDEFHPVLRRQRHEIDADEPRFVRFLLETLARRGPLDPVRA